MPAVTFIVPAYNAGETLPDTLAAIADQTRTDWSAIIVDDGSNDDTFDLARKRLSDSHFRLLRKSNGGASSARNLGARLAETPWLVFLDSDDLITPDYLAQMLEQGEKVPPGDNVVVVCAGRRLAADGRLGPIDTPPARDHAIHLRSGNIFYTHAVMVPRTRFWSLGGFDERLTTCEDWEFWVRLFGSNPQAIPVKEPLAIYRLRPGSLTKNNQSLFDEASAVVRFAYAEAQYRSRDLSEIDDLLAIELATSLFLARLWAFGVSVAVGNVDAMTIRRHRWPQGIMPREMASFFIAGFTHGACRLSSDWPAIWDEVGSAVSKQFRVAFGIDELSENCLEQIAGFAGTTGPDSVSELG